MLKILHSFHVHMRDRHHRAEASEQLRNVSRAWAAQTENQLSSMDIAHAVMHTFLQDTELLHEFQEMLAWK